MCRGDVKLNWMILIYLTPYHKKLTLVYKTYCNQSLRNINSCSPFSRKSFARRAVSRLTGAGAGEGAAMVGERRKEKITQER